MDIGSLVALAGSTLAAAAVTDAWETTRHMFVRLFRRGQPDSTTERQLDATRDQVSAASPSDVEHVKAAVAAEWAVRLKDLLADHPSAEAELRALVEEVQALLPAGVVSATDHSLAAGRDFNIDASGRGVAAGVIHGNVAARDAYIADRMEVHQGWSPRPSPPDTSAAVEYIDGLLSSGISFQAAVRRVLRLALESALPANLLTTEHLAVALLKEPESSWRSALKENGTNPAEVLALLEARCGQIPPSSGQPKVTDTVRDVMADAIRTARRQRKQVDDRLLTISLLSRAERLAGILEQVHSFPVGNWLRTLRAPESPIRTP